jgi:hypothetical protein
MKTINERLEILKDKLNANEPVTIMIIGLGSVGLYFLDYLITESSRLPALRIIATGRNTGGHMESDVNIVKIASLIRGQNRTIVKIDDDCDLTIPDKIINCVVRHKPDFILNTSRVYSGLKYGSLSWHNIRAYGIWSPLAIRYIRDIMLSVEQSGVDTLVINTSYSDAVIPWLKSAKKPYPDFGSGNLNHLIPRIKFAVAEMAGITDYWNIKVQLVTAHFHDVVISKEGHTENIDPLLAINYHGKMLSLDTKEIYRRCKIVMPVDAKRNMMNASSNFDIISSIINALKNGEIRKFHSPGAFGYIGGYPVNIDGNECEAYIDQSIFKLPDMIAVNRKSIALDGVENIENGILTYTDALKEKVRKAFGVVIPLQIPFSAIDETAAFIIENIIKPNTK